MCYLAYLNIYVFYSPSLNIHESHINKYKSLGLLLGAEPHSDA